jgi:two-component system, cell cycle sensor histidine kinase DivJ
VRICRAKALRQIDWITPARDYVDRLVHPSAQADPLVAARHRAFIAAQLVAGFLAVALFPGYLALRGTLSLSEALAFTLLSSPILVALYVSRTGRFEAAHLLASALLCGLVALVAAKTGGIASFALAWALIVPLEACLSGSRHVISVAAALAALVVAGIGFADQFGWLPAAVGPASSPALSALGVLAAIAYGSSIALTAHRLDSLGADIARSGEARYAMLAENMNDLVTRHGASGHVTYASPAANALAGVRAEELLGQGLFERVHVSDRPLYLSALSDALAKDMATAAEFRLRRDSEEGLRFVWVEMRCRPAGPEGARHVVAVMHDVSARKLHQLEVEKARAVAEEANAAKSRFVATMSHELRTPLNAVIGFSEMLMNEEAMNLDLDRRKEYAQLIHDSGEHLLAVVNGILDMSKIESGTFAISAEPFAVKELVASCRSMMLLKAEKSSIRLVATVDPDVPEILADKRACRQIFLNLMSNALKFTPEGGCVIVGARREREGIALFVTDTGVGIGGDDLPRLGEAFFQASSSYNRTFEGTGLGLSVVKGLAELHGGRMEIQSVLGKGTTVAVHLPLECATPTPAVAREATVERLPERTVSHGQEAEYQRGKKRA